MKYLKQILVFLLFVPVLFSCEQDANTESDDNPDEQSEITKETISAKWLVKGNNSVYESFEFDLNGNYIVVENTSYKSTNDINVHVGSYEILYGLEMAIELQDFGILEDVIFGSNTGSFSVTTDADPDNKVSVDVEKDEVMEESVNTELLSNSWLFARATWYTAADGTTDEVDIPVGYRAVVAITYYGTYTGFESYNGEEERTYGNWMWADDSESSFLAWRNDQSFGEATRANILTLTKNDMILSYNAPDGDIITEYYVPEPSGQYW